MNGWLIAGAITGGITYLLIQKGAMVNAAKNKTEIENKVDAATNQAINSIQTTADSTKKKIEENADKIIDGLEIKATALDKTLSELEEKALRSTKLIRTDIQENAQKTNILVESEGLDTRGTVKEEANKTREFVDKKSNSNISLLKEQMLNKLKPSLRKVSTTWLELHRAYRSIEDLDPKKVGYDPWRKAAKIDDTLGDQISILYSEIRSSIAFLKNLKDSPDKNEIVKYLYDLVGPYNKAMDELLGPRYEGKNGLDIKCKYYNEMRELDIKFDSIYSLVLRLE